MIILRILATRDLYIFSLKGWENVLFELRSERAKKRKETKWNSGETELGDQTSDRAEIASGKEMHTETRSGSTIVQNPPGRGEGVNPIYKPYRYVPPQRASFSSIPSPK